MKSSEKVKTQELSKRRNAPLTTPTNLKVAPARDISAAMRCWQRQSI